MKMSLSLYIYTHNPSPPQDKNISSSKQIMGWIIPIQNEELPCLGREALHRPFHSAQAATLNLRIYFPVMVTQEGQM